MTGTYDFSSLYRQCQSLITCWILRYLNDLQLWNVFDSSFIVIFLVYLGYRIKGLTQNDRECKLLY